MRRGRSRDSRLTPGETRPITLEEVCLYEKAEVISRDIPLDVQQKVFAAYGIKSPQKDQFEVDYLITPDLGGTESIKQPLAAAVFGALECACEGQAGGTASRTRL
jgi:hypothetical protein